MRLNVHISKNRIIYSIFDNFLELFHFDFSKKILAPIPMPKLNCSTGKSVSEAPILESFNPQYDERLFIEFPEKYKFRTCCEQILFRMSKKQTKKQFLYTTCSELVFFGEFN
jgi:hypothetical protein